MMGKVRSMAKGGKKGRVGMRQMMRQMGLDSSVFGDGSGGFPGL